MTQAKTIAWAAVARGQDFNGAQFHHVISGSTKSARAAEIEAEQSFRKSLPNARYIGVTSIAIREGD